jgi:hypothetical protein
MVRRKRRGKDLSGDSGFELGDGSLLLTDRGCMTSRDQLQLSDGRLLATDQEAHPLHLHSQRLGRVEMQVLFALA